MATSSLISAAFFIFLLHLATSVSSIGVNYGTLGDNLPSPQAVANFLKTKTTIDSVKIFDVSPQILQVFAGSGISVTIIAPNGDIPALTNLDSARQWVVAHIKPLHLQTKIKYILVGSEVLHWIDWNTIKLLVPAMRTLHRALNAEGIRDIKDPITVTSGITYNRESIEKLLFSGKNNTCPVTRLPLSVSDSSDLVPNHTLRRLIQSWCTINASHGI
ncbi:hypothetical protein K1719_035374 [Acacia pycnantha]|nr:hypothetical protein K1719_035374 [Acacia pycnantha]